MDNPNVTSQLISGISRDEMAVIYSVAILADDDVTITADKLTTILRAANLSNVEPIWPTLYARALGSGCDIRKLLTSVSAVGNTAPTQQPRHADDKNEKVVAAAVVKKDAEPEIEDDSDSDLNLDLFG